MERDSAIATDHSGSDSAVFDLAAALERLEGDRDLLGELCGVLREDCDRAIKEMRQALSETDFTRLERLAHTLKGSSASLCALEVSAEARELEQLARDRDVSGAGASLEALARKGDRLRSELELLSERVGH